MHLSVVLSEPRDMREEGFQASVPRLCRSLFSECFSKGTKSRQDAEMTPVPMPPPCGLPRPPRSPPAPPLRLLLFIVSKQTHVGVATVVVSLVFSPLSSRLGAVSPLCRGKSRSKSRSGCCLHHSHPAAPAAAASLKISSFDAQELSWRLSWQISIYAAVCPYTR